MKPASLGVSKFMKKILLGFFIFFVTVLPSSAQLVDDLKPDELRRLAGDYILSDLPIGEQAWVEPNFCFMGKDLYILGNSALLMDAEYSGEDYDDNKLPKFAGRTTSIGDEVWTRVEIQPDHTAVIMLRSPKPHNIATISVYEKFNFAYLNEMDLCPKIMDPEDSYRVKSVNGVTKLSKLKNTKF